MIPTDVAARHQRTAPHATASTARAATGDHGRGQGLVEYALLLSLVALAVIVALICLGAQLGGLYR